MVEFQVLDVDTARNNEVGENAHHLYKARQHAVVARPGAGVILPREVTQGSFSGDMP